jgi:hypothetical protein
MKTIIIILQLMLLSNILNCYELTVPLSPAGACFKDVDDDGFIDIILGHRTTWQSTSPNISILLNDGLGRFSIVDSSITSCGYQDYLILDDLNNDGDTELVTMSVDFSTGVADRFFRIYTNFGLGAHNYTDYPLQRNGTIQKWICFSAPDNSHYLAFICNQDMYWGYIHFSNTGQQLSQVYYDLSLPPQDINFVDVDTNGYYDVIVQCADIELWKGFSYGFEHVTLSGQVYVRQGLVADIDNNEANEYVTLYKMLLPYTVISVYSLDAVSVTQQYYFFVDQTAIYPQVGDIDNDEYIDFIYTSSHYAPQHISDTSYTWIIKNINGVLDSITIAYFTGNNSYMSYLIDVNNDGWNDIITTNRSNPSKIHVLYNDGSGNYLEESPTSNVDVFNTIPQIRASNSPNPFRNHTNISIKTQSPLINPTLEIYNIKGQLIRTIGVQGKSNNLMTAIWDGKDCHGCNAVAGIYLIRFKTNRISVTQKVLKL